MSRNGDVALRKIILCYSPIEGSTGMRQFMATHLPDLKAQYPSVEIDIRPRRWALPSVTGMYKDGSERAFQVRELSALAIFSRCQRLVSDANDVDIPFSLDSMHLQRRSIQGTWNPWLWRGDRPQPKQIVPKWDRKLGNKEWDYYIDKYSSRMRADEDAIQAEVDSRTELFNEYTQEVQERWTQHVAPRLQSDMKSNLEKMKADIAAGIKPEPVNFNEYRLFSVPDHRELGITGSVAVRRKEIQHRHRWWAKRKEQLKPPQ